MKDHLKEVRLDSHERTLKLDVVLGTLFYFSLLIKIPILEPIYTNPFNFLRQGQDRSKKMRNINFSLGTLIIIVNVYS